MVDRYEAQMPDEWQADYSTFRSALQGVDPKDYRGMSRIALDPWPSHDPDSIDAFRRAGIDMDSDRAARVRLLELAEQAVGTPVPAEYEEGVLPSLEMAEEVLQLVDAPEEWEVVFVSKSDLTPVSQTMGIDAGWWGGAFYSIIWDSVVCPTWHAPPPDVWPRLSDQTGDLNEHVMFDDPEHASDFLRWYESEPWAERNGFTFVRVDKVV